MPIPRPALAGLLVTALAVGGVAAASAPASASVLSTVTQNVLPGLANATDLGAVPASTPLTLTVTLARPDPAGEQALLTAEHTPGSSAYGTFLTPAQFAARFGVPTDRRQAVRTYLTGGGLIVDGSSTAGDIVRVHGTTAQVGSLFRTTFHSYSLAGSTFVANTAAPVSPASLGITNVSGLNSLQHYSTPSKATPSQDTCVATTCTGLTTPQDLWSVYDQPAAYAGRGQQLAVFGEGQTDHVISELRTFEQLNKLPAIPVAVKHPAGDTDFSDDAGAEEWNIDTQASSGMAPAASKLTLYFGHDLSDADVQAVFSQFTDDASGPKQASASYGECETVPVVSPIAGIPLLNPALPVGQGLGNNSDYTLGQITRQTALEGKTVFVSTGDTGSSCPVAFGPVIGAGNGVLNQGAPITNSPASLPYVTAVGGTVLYTDGKGARSREYGWAFSGGGSTLFTPAPDYQRGTQGLYVSCLTDPTQVCRGIADVAAQSGDVVGNGYAIQTATGASAGGGTSLSAPLWQGMWARVQGAKGAVGNGFANYALYRLGKNPTTYARDYSDVSSTDPTTGLPASNGAYVTTPGWDYVTGFGTPKVAAITCDLTRKAC